jgi:hypothetical protein
MEMPDGIWMIRYYTYDGYSRYDMNDVQFAWEYETAKGKLDNWLKKGKLEGYDWEFDGVDDHILTKRGEDNEFSYYFIQFMMPGEDID